MIGSKQKYPSENKQHSQTTDIYDLGGIRTRNPNKRSTAEPRLRPRGHWGSNWGSNRKITDEDSSRFQSPVLILAQLFNRCGLFDVLARLQVNVVIIFTCLLLGSQYNREEILTVTLTHMCLHTCMCLYLCVCVCVYVCVGRVAQSV